MKFNIALSAVWLALGIYYLIWADDAAAGIGCLVMSKLERDNEPR